MMQDNIWTCPHIDKSSLLVCRVCSHWRAAALGALELRDNIAVTFRDPRFAAAHMEMAKSWLPRAGARDLTLGIFFFHSISNLIIDLVTPLSNQIRTLQLTSAPIGCLKSLLDLPFGSLPSLCTLDIAFPPPHFLGARKSDAMPETEIFPHLQNFSILTGWNFLNPEVLPIRWSQLTTLHMELTGGDLLSLYSVLAQCTSLSTCYLCITELAVEGSHIAINPLTLPKITELTVMLAVSFDYCLSCFIFPALSTVVIGHAVHLSRQPSLSMLPSLASPVLRGLSIKLPCNSNNIPTLLQGCPNLPKLQMCFDELVVETHTHSTSLVPQTG
ncbi:hypothetical protein B0H10DRAFT_1937653 [Mycena sp. CBHHK59/15]|nr:hypothetical protein B0H10DRAFT_1937653 [Mycena sp. CBHHK59/15]